MTENNESQGLTKEDKLTTFVAREVNRYDALLLTRVCSVLRTEDEVDGDVVSRIFREAAVKAFGEEKVNNMIKRFEEMDAEAKQQGYELRDPWS